MTIRLTPRELDCLCHRLCLDDALAEVLEDDGEFCGAEVAVRAAQLLTDIGRAEALPDNPDAMTRAIIVDCVEGSTWVGTLIPDGSPQAVSAATRTLEALADKVKAWAGLQEIQVPLF